MRVLVTGGAGYIGSIVVEELLAAGHDAVVCDNLQKGHADAVDEAAVFVRGDVLDTEMLRGVRTVEKVTGRRVPVRVGPRRPGDPPVLVASSRRIIEALGWRPTRQALADIVDSAWRWMVTHAPAVVTPAPTPDPR